MVYIVIIELVKRKEMLMEECSNEQEAKLVKEIKRNEILTEVYSNYQEAKLTYNVIVRSLNEGKCYNFDNQQINTSFVKSVRLLEREIICQR